MASRALEFGQVVTCRTCRGTGQVRHVANHEAERERARRRKQGEDVPPPPSHDVCPTCLGNAILPAALADRNATAEILARQLAGEELADGSRPVRP